MRKIREILRLKFECGLSARMIASSCAIARSTVADCLGRLPKAGLSWPVPDGLDDERLEALLYPPPPAPSSRVTPLPNWAEVSRELRKKGVTLQLLWEEYRQSHPDSYAYSRFCDLYRAWGKCVNPSMRQAYKAGEKCFVDYAGQTIPVVDPDTGEIQEASLFVGALGASSYTYAEAQLHQDLANWTGAHVRMFRHFQGSTRVLTPDNLKSGVKRPCFYEPDINPTYHDLAVHYGCVVLPARPRRPRDKAKAEAAVLVATRWILARLRHRTFFSLADLNVAVGELLESLNHRTMRHFGLSRAELFEQLDRPALQPLPEHPYRFALWKKPRVNIDHHVDVEGHYYSVPYTLIHQVLDARIEEFTIELFHKGKRVASHPRSRKKGFASTLPEHRPASHRFVEWSPERFTRWAATLGPHTEQLVAAILSARVYPEQAYRTCLGILNLGKRCGPERLEAACRRALHFGVRSWKGVKNILDNRLEEIPLPVATQEELPLGPHENVRGKTYFC
ncbi:MAG: IS21 family transposase [Deltaproteobacteria bacterium]|nr:IS21 family transposase [Deltaproteobacteria bacterium]